MAKRSRTWSVTEARAKLSALIDSAISEGPQTISRNGRKAVVVVSAQEWERNVRRKGNLAEFFASSTLRGSRIHVRPRSMST